MRNLKTTLAVALVIMGFTSCSKTYRCVCEYRPGIPQISNTPAYEIKAGSRASAVKKCDAKEAISWDCTLE